MRLQVRSVLISLSRVSDSLARGRVRIILSHERKFKRFLNAISCAAPRHDVLH
jgi:hypothetical protein